MTVTNMFNKCVSAFYVPYQNCKYMNCGLSTGDKNIQLWRFITLPGLYFK